MTHGRVMKRPPSWGQHCRMGKSSTLKFSRRMTCFAGSIFGGDEFGEEFSHLGEHGEHADFVEEAFRRAQIHQLANAVGNIVE